jgi:hypothetical protein
MKRGERIPLHDHSDRNAGGPVAPFTVQQATGSSTTGGSTGGGGSHADADHTAFMFDPSDGREDVSALGTVGATTTVDPTLGNVVSMTLSANCTATISEPFGSGASTLELWVTQDGTGGWVLTIAATGGAVTGDISAHTTTAGETFRVIAERIPATTNDWVVDLVGGSSVAALDDLTDVNAPAPADGDVLTWDSTPGEWVAAAPTGAVTEAAVRDIGHWEVVVSGTGPPVAVSTPDDDDDWVYAWVPG